jgi:hypothetical protein
MSGPTRLRVVPICLALLFSACSGGSVATPAQPVADNAPSLSASETEALSTRTALAALDFAPDAGAPTRALSRRIPAFRPNAKEPPFIINLVYAGAAISGLPCFGCVGGEPDGLLLPGTNNLVPADSVWQYGLTFSDLTFTGNCKMSWSIAAGKKVLDSFSTKYTIKTAGGLYIFDFNRNRPKYSGSAVLAGKVTCGAGSQTTQAALYFE